MLSGGLGRKPGQSASNSAQSLADTEAGIWCLHLLWEALPALEWGRVTAGGGLPTKASKLLPLESLLCALHIHHSLFLLTTTL